MQMLKRNAGFLLFLGVVILGTWVTSDETGGLSFDTLFGSQISDQADERDDIDSIYKRARAFDANGDFEEAVIQYTDIIERNPNDATAYESRCWAFYRLKKLEHAVTDCTTALEINPNFSDALAGRCFAYQSMGDQEKAIEDCTQAMELDPDYASLYTARADAYRELWDYETALKDYNRSLEIDSENGVAYNNRALLHEEMGNTDLAMSDYNNAIKYYNPVTDYNVHIRWHNRGMLHQEFGEYDKAIYDFRKAIDLHPSYIRAMISLGDIFYDLGRYPQSLELYETVVRLEDSGIEETLWDTSFIPDTIIELQELIATQESLLGEHVELFYAGREAQIREDYTTAIETYTELIDLVPDFYDVYFWRAQSLEEVQLYPDALKDYQVYYDNATDTNEFYYSASYRIDDLSLLVNFAPKAVELYQEALDVSYDNSDKALDLYTQAIEIDSTFAKAYQQRAYLNHYTLFDWESALEDYKSYVALGDNPELYRYEMWQLDAMIALPDDAQSCLQEVRDYYYNDDSDLTTDDLIERLTCVIDLAPDYAPAYVDRGEEYEYDYQYTEAVADYEMYLSLVEVDAELSAIFEATNDDDYYDEYYDDYGYYDEDIYYYSPDYIQSSLDIMYPYLALSPEALEQWENAVRAYYNDDENLIAIGYLSQVITTEPDFADALSLRGRIYYNDGDYENALPDLQAYITLVEDDDLSYYEQTLVTEIETLLTLPSDVQDLFQQAKVADNNYDSPLAIDLYTQVIEKYPEVTETYFERGQLYEYEGDYDLALADFNTYISLASEDNPHADQLEWTLEYLNEMFEGDDTVDEAED
jgi:tetratricopeptide (TPR) repeat protein